MSESIGPGAVDCLLTGFGVHRPSLPSGIEKGLTVLRALPWGYLPDDP